MKNNANSTSLKKGLLPFFYKALHDFAAKLKIMDLKINVTGSVSENIKGYYLDIIVSGIMFLPCSISLKKTEYPFSINITEEISKKNTNLLDIFPIIWENILVEVPIKVVNENLDEVITSGEGWRLITEE